MIITPVKKVIIIANDSLYVATDQVSFYLWKFEIFRKLQARCKSCKALKFKNLRVTKDPVTKEIVP